MRHKRSRYIQPDSALDAMRLIQKLFNKYRHAPLTKELLDYHNNLIDRLNGDILQAAKNDGDQQVLKNLKSMVTIMREWTGIRLAGKPYRGKMRHFKFIPDGGMKFKRIAHRQGASHNYRSSRH